MLRIFALILALMIFGLLIYGCIKLERKMDYKLFYRDLIEQTIKEMVKSECLKDKWEIKSISGNWDEGGT